MWRLSDIKEYYKTNHYDDISHASEPIKPFINHEIVEKVDELQEFDENSVKNVSYWDEANVSELARVFENADERDVLTVCYVAVRRFPLKYLTVLMDYLLEKGEN